MSIASKFSSVGMYVPPKVVENKDLEQMMDTSDEWIRQRTGIERRHWAEITDCTSDFALRASQEAIQKAGIENDEIDMILLATLSPDHDFPGTACFLQAKLGVSGIPAIDIRQQCSGFLYGMSIADNFIKSGQYKNILLVGAELHSKGLNRTPAGRDVAVLFGDGAGAAVISATEVSDSKTDSHILASQLHSDGHFAKELWMPAPGTGFQYKDRMDRAMFDDDVIWPKMNGKTVFVHATKKMGEVLVETLKRAQAQPDEVDLFIFHQANLRINDKVAEMLKVPSEKVFNTIHNYGNTTAATIPIGLYEAEKQGILKPGMLVASAAFGSGFTWASSVYRW